MSFSCPYCGEEFERKTEMMTHVRVAHKDEIKRKRELQRQQQQEEEEEKEEGGRGVARPDRRIQIEPPVYKPMDPRDIMLEVVRSPVLNLTENQIAELQDIADDFDGVLSPIMLKRILSNFDGITEKKAQFIADRYAIKLEKARDRLSIADAERLGLNLTPSAEQSREEKEDLETKIARGVQKGLRGLESRLNISNDIFAEPISKILSNAADASGIVSRIINIFFTGIEEQVKRDPYIIGDARDILPQLPKLVSSSRSEDRNVNEEENLKKKISNSRNDEEEEREEKYRRNDRGGASRERAEDIFNALDKYFEEEEEEGDMFDDTD